jgi:hypothetical protein
MEQDQILLATNLIAMGYFMNQFFLSLFNVWGWTEPVNQMAHTLMSQRKKQPQRRQQQQQRSSSLVSGTNNVSWKDCEENMKYQCMAHVFGENVMGPIDAGNQLVASRCAEFMTIFFKQIQVDTIMWFTPRRIVKDDDDDDE